MKKNNLIKKIVIIIPLIILLLLTKKVYINQKYLTGTIINKNINYFEIITPKDTIYKINHAIETEKIDVGTNVKIIYSKNIDDLNEFQEISIKKIEIIDSNSNYSKTANDILNNMSLKEKIGQLLLVRVPYSEKIETIKKYNIGGYLLFQRDVENRTKQQLINDIEAYQNASKIPLIIAIDEEGGDVSRLNFNKNIVKSPFLSPQELYKIGGFNKIKEDTINKTKLLKELGINMNLAPIADITTDPNAFMYKRSFGKNKEQTSEYIKTVISSQTENVTYVIKHFPGYGNNGDTHLNIVVDNRPLETIINNDLLPFKVGIDYGAKAILISHNIVTSIENKPASISRITHNILRNDLNFTGITITDDLSMNGLQKYGSKTPYIDAILAGNNILIVSDYITAFDEIYYGVIENKISEALINKLVIKNIQFKIDEIY